MLQISCFHNCFCEIFDWKCFVQFETKICLICFSIVHKIALIEIGICGKWWLCHDITVSWNTGSIFNSRHICTLMAFGVPQSVFAHHGTLAFISVCAPNVGGRLWSFSLWWWPTRWPNDMRGVHVARRHLSFHSFFILLLLLIEKSIKDPLLNSFSHTNMWSMLLMSWSTINSQCHWYSSFSSTWSF